MSNPIRFSVGIKGTPKSDSPDCSRPLFACTKVPYSTILINHASHPCRPVYHNMDNQWKTGLTIAASPMTARQDSEWNSVGRDEGVVRHSMHLRDGWWSTCLQATTPLIRPCYHLLLSPPSQSRTRTKEDALIIFTVLLPSGSERESSQDRANRRFA